MTTCINFNTQILVPALAFIARQQDAVGHTGSSTRCLSGLAVRIRLG